MASSTTPVVLYTHRTCPGGNRAWQYFREHNIPCQVKDIVVDAEAFAEFQSHGGFATPVIVIGNSRLIGFDEAEVEQLLHRHSDA